MPKVEQTIAEMESKQIHIKKDNLEYVLWKDGNGFYMSCHEAGEYSAA